MKEQKENVYNSFIEKHKEFEKMQTIKILNLTSEENFLIQDLSDLEESKKHLTLLEKLNFSDNLVSKLKLKKFPSLDSIIGIRNTLTEVSLNLGRLTRLDLSHNMITKIFDLSNLPLLTYLNLSYNLISQINIASLFPVHKTLEAVFLDYNEIDFSSSSEFISLIEGMKGIYRLEDLKLEGNLFIKKRKELTKNYKILVAAMLPQLIKLDDETFTLNRSTLDPEQIVSQILRDEKEINYNFITQKSSVTKTKMKSLVEESLENTKPFEETASPNLYKIKNTYSGVFINLMNMPGSPLLKRNSILPKNLNYWEILNTQIIIPLKKINDTFEEFNHTELKDQAIFMKLIEEVKSLLSTKFTNMQIRYANKINIKKLLDEEFTVFLMNCQILIDVDPNYEEVIYKAVAQFVMFAKGKVFAENAFDFFSTLIKASTFKNDLIKEIIEGGIISQLKDQEDEMPMYTLIQVLNFFNSSSIRCDKLYTDLIDRVFANYETILDDLESLIQYPLDNHEVIRNYEACIEFIKKFLDLNKMDRTQRNALRDEDQKMRKNSENEDNSFDSCSSNSYLSNSSVSSNDEQIDSLHTNNYQDDLHDEVSPEYSITKDKKENPEKKEKINLREGIGFLEFFRIIYESCILIYSKIEIIMHLRNYNSLWNFFHKTIELLNSLCKNFDHLCNKYKVTNSEKEKLRLEINTNNKIKIKNLEKFITFIMNEYFKDVNAFNNSLESNIFRFKDKNSSENKLAIQKYKIILQKLLVSYGCILRLENNTEYFEKDLVLSIVEVLNFIKNDEFILIGSIKFIFQIILNNRLESQMYKKLLTKVKYFQILFRYINYEDICYRGLYDKIYEENQPNYKKILEKNNSLLTLYTFENLKSKQIHKIFAQIIKIYRHISHLSIIENPLKNLALQTIENFKEFNALKLISNCLKIPNDKLKKLTVESLYYTEKKYLTSDVIGQIIKIITAYESVTRGETEIILSVVFILMTDLLYYHKIKDTTTDVNFDFVNFKKLLRFSFDILKKNLDRNPTNFEEIEQKNILSMSIQLYLNSVSRYEDIYSDLMWDGIENDFRTIILYDLMYFQPDTYVPFEIERTYCGNFLSILLKVVQTKEAIPPYSYPFLRVFIKIADVLCYFDEFSYPVDSGNDVHGLLYKLEKDIKKRIENQNIKEKLAWDQWDCENNLEEIKENLKMKKRNDSHVKINDEVLFEYDKILYNYTAFKEMDKKEWNASSAIGNFNSTQNAQTESEDSLNNNYVESTAFPKQSLEALIQEHFNFLAFFPVVLNYLTGQCSNMINTKIYQNLKKKFDKRIERSVEILALIPKPELKAEYSLEEMNSLANIHPSIAKYLKLNLNSKSKQFTENELNNNNIMLSLIMTATNKNDNFYRTTMNENTKTDFPDDFKAGTFDKYGFSKIQKRIMEQESVDNPYIRSLLISALLRCTYALLISPSKKIRENFIEILFIESIWKDFILYIDTSTTFEFNILNKILIVFERIFNKRNLIQFFTIFINVNCDKDNSQNIKKIKDDVSIPKIYAFNKEKKIFHFYYIFVIYFEKMLKEYYNNYFKPEIYDLFLIKNITLTIHSFISNFEEINFSQIDEKFIEQNIYKKIFRNENLNILLFSFKSLCLMRKKAMNKLKEISFENIQFKYKKIVSDKMKLDSVFDEIDNETINHIILFVDDIETTILKLKELFGIIMCNYPEGEMYIYEQILKVFETEEKEYFMFEKFIKKDEWESKNYSEKVISLEKFNFSFNEDNYTKMSFLENKEDKVFINKQNFFETKKEFSKKKKIFLELFAFDQKIIFNTKSIKHFLAENISVSNSVHQKKTDFTISSDICEYQSFNSNSIYFTLVYLNREEVFLFKIEDNLLSEFSTKRISETFLQTVKNPLLKMKIEEVSTIFYFDYQNRIVIKSNKNEFSLIFKSTNNSRRFVENLKSYTANKNLIIKNLSLIKDEIFTQDNLDNYISKKLNERKKLLYETSSKNQNKEKKEFLRIKTENEMNEKKKQQNEIKNEFKIGNSIWNNFYSNDYFFAGIDSFLVKFKKNILFKEGKNVMYISEFYLYILEENFKKFSSINYEDPVDKKSTYNIYKQLIKIKLEDINSIEKYSNLSLKLNYTEVDSNTNQNLIFSFFGFFEYFLFVTKIDSAIHQILIETKAKSLI